MSISHSHKSSNTQIYQLMVYRRALHPELIDLRGRRRHRHDEYEAEMWVAPAGHVVRFAVNGQHLAEALVECGDHLPETGLVHALPCIGEKEYEMERPGPIGYFSTVQIETLTDNLFMATYREMTDFAEETKALAHTWQNDGERPNLSLLDVQKYKRELHLQSYHLMGNACIVLRTQSIFEVL
jgi:hypothetical protein